MSLKSNSRRTLTVLVFVLSFPSADFALGRDEQVARGGQLLAGVARLDITPPLGTPLGGYGARKGKPSVGVHDPLYANALVLDDGRERIAICTADMVLMPSSLYDDVVKLVAKRTKIHAGHILICASHSHASFGAAFKETKSITGSFNLAVYRQTVNGLAQVIIQAERKLEPARYGSGLGRRDDLSRNRTRDGGPIDPDVYVLRIDRRDGSPMAALVNFAAHPTVLGPSVMEFSADFVGYLAGSIEEAKPGIIAMYANGTQGNVAPRPPAGEGDAFASCQRMGRALAGEALKVFDGIKTTDAVKIKVAFQPVYIKLNANLGVRTYLQQFAIDGDLIVAIPGEAFVELGQDIKRHGKRLGFAHVMTFGLANGSIGYLLPRQLWLKHEYESLVSAAGIELGPFIRDTHLRLMEKLRQHVNWLPGPEKPLEETPRQIRGGPAVGSRRSSEVSSMDLRR